MSSNNLLLKALQSSEAEKEEQRAQFEEQRAQLEEQRAQLEEQRAQLEEQRAQLEEQRAQLEEQENLIEELKVALKAVEPKTRKKWTKEEGEKLLEMYEELGADIRPPQRMGVPLEKMHIAIARTITSKTPGQIYAKLKNDGRRECWFGGELKKIIEKVRTKMFMKMREDN